MLWGLAVNGAPGAAEVLQMLKEELAWAMAPQRPTCHPQHRSKAGALTRTGNLSLQTRRLSFRQARCMLYGKSPPKQPASASASQWRAVCIVPAAPSCALARSMTDRPWLYAEAPRLPLPGCDTPLCNCRYKHLPDRRSVERRRIDRTGLPRNHSGPELRAARRGRRHTDYYY